jgi:hypothetical protein
MFIPDPGSGFFPSQIPNPDRGVNKAADSGSGSATMVKTLIFKTFFINIKGHLNTWILIRIRIQQINETGSFPDLDPQPCSEGPRDVGMGL